MKRSKSHIISKKAQKIFEGIVPPEQVIRKQLEDDYGIDYEVELFVFNEEIQDWETTGLIFKVQLKGTENPNELENGDRIAFSFEADKGEYLVEQIEIPAVIVLVDTQSRQIYWTDVQGNKLLENAYEVAKQAGHGSFTIYFDKTNRLPNTWNKLVNSMIQSANTLSLRRAATINAPSYAEYVEGINDLDSELVHLHEKIDIANADRVRRLMSERKFEEAEALILKIVESEERSVEAKFDALLRTEQIFVRDINKLRGYGKANFDIELAEKLMDLTRSEDVSNDLKLLAQGYDLTAHIFYCSVHDFRLHNDLVMRTQALLIKNMNPFDTTWDLIAIERIENRNKLLNKLDEFDQYVLELISNRYWQYLPDLLTRISASLIHFLYGLVGEDSFIAADEVVKRLRFIVEFNLDLIENLDSKRQADEVVRRCLLTYLQLIDIFQSDAKHRADFYATAKDMIPKAHNANLRQRLQYDLDQAMRL